MTALNDLTDVDAPSPSDDDVLTYDGGVWVAQPAPAGGDWNVYDATFSYPAGDNGWVLVAEPAAAVDHSENVVATPSDDNAMVYEFTVTEAMVDVTATGDTPGGFIVGLRISISFGMTITASRTLRTSVTVNGELRAYRNATVFAGRVRLGTAHVVQCAEGDVVKVHAWTTSALASGDSIELVAVGAVPGVIGAPNFDDDSRILYARSVDFHPYTSEVVDTAPAALSGAAMIGTADTNEVLWLRSEGEGDNLIFPGQRFAAWGLLGGVGAFVNGPLSSPQNSTFTTGRWALGVKTESFTSATSGSDPYLWNTRRLTGLDFQYLDVADPLS